MPRLHSWQKIRVVSCGRGNRSGMTLLEVTISLALMVATLVGFSYMALGTASLNRRTELVVSATNAMGKQLSAISAIANSTENRKEADGAAKAMVLYLRNLRNVVASKSDYPVRVDWLPSIGVIRYEFPVAVPGDITGEIATVTGNAKVRQNAVGRGVLYAYLNESSVSSTFYNWKTYYSTGLSESSGLNHFDMDGDGQPGGDFSSLMTASVNKYPASTLKTLPISVALMYYTRAKDLEDARQWEASNPNDLYGAQAYASFSLTRDYIINDSAVLGLGVY